MSLQHEKLLQLLIQLHITHEMIFLMMLLEEGVSIFLSLPLWLAIASTGNHHLFVCIGQIYNLSLENSEYLPFFNRVD